MNLQMIDFEIKGNEEGRLVALENNISIPFSIKRVYYITNTKYGVIRGNHAHKNLKQVLICVNGSCKIGLDNGNEKAEVLLDQMNKGLYIESNIWRTMYDFSDEAVLLVIASELYDESDYIRNYDDFIQYISQ